MIGYYDDAPNINREEVEDWKWMKIEDVKSDMETHPALYTVWFKLFSMSFIIF
jgi:isopentenyl-diphosphate delta-isomerase